MPRTKPTTIIDAIGRLDLFPEKVAAEYAASKKENEICVKPPNWNSAGDSIELLFVRNESEHLKMLELQHEMLENSKRTEAINKARTQHLYKIQANLRNRFVDVNSFMKECSDKQRAAEKVIADEELLHAELQKNIQKHRETLDELNEFRECLAKTVDEMKPYETVMEDVVKKSTIFNSINECMDRTDAIMLAQLEITGLLNQKKLEIDKMRKRMINITNQAALTALGMKNELAELQRDYIVQRNICFKWERIFAEAKSAVITNNIQKIRLYDSIKHMYLMLCNRRGIEPIHRQDIVKSLDFIREEVWILQEVVKKCNVNTNEKATSGDTFDKVNVQC